MTDHPFPRHPSPGPVSDPKPDGTPMLGCHLCGLPLHRGVVAEEYHGTPLHFCCQGCRAVYHMLLTSLEVQDPARFKETDLYRRCVAAGVIPADEDDLQRIRASEAREIPAPGVSTDNESESAIPETLSLQLRVDGMWCTACAWVIERTLARLDGVEGVACQFFTDRLRCRYRPDRVAPHEIRQTVARLGYGLRDTEAGIGDRSLQHRQLTRVAVTGILSANVMMLSWALFAGFFTQLSAAAVSAISLPIVAMATVVLVYGGGSILRRAWFGLIRGAPGMDTLVGLGSMCTYLYSLYNWSRGSIHLYFDTACMLIALVLLGRLLEQKAKGRVHRDLEAFFALQPAKVRLMDPHWPEGRYVAIDQLAVGDCFGVAAGEIVPADGRVVDGGGRLDEASLTGEPAPVTVQPGDTIKSGTRLLDGKVTATTEKVGGDTVLGQMIAVMTGGLAQQDTHVGKTDRMLAWFAPMILLLAMGTGLWAVWAGLTMDEAVVRAVTVMVIACPCALGVAIPMARLAGVSLAGREGILIRDPAAFERATAVDAVVFDKTGTLTRGRWQLLRIDCRPGHDPDVLAAWAAGLEESTDHEVARALRMYAAFRNLPPEPATAVTVTPDGVEGWLHNRMVRIGKQDFAWSDTPDPAMAPESDEGGPTSRVHAGIDGQPAAVFHFGDTLRDGMPQLIRWLKQGRWEVHLVSGDDDAAARSAARALDVAHVRGGLLPVEKAAYVDGLARQGRRVAMVGDGVNDAAAMTRAHLAVAVHSGGRLAAEAAHVTFMRGDPAQLMDLFSLAHRVNRKVLQNLGCAWIYNLISIPVAMSGLLTPLVAVTAMLLSSLTVIGNTLRLLRKRG